LAVAVVVLTAVVGVDSLTGCTCPALMGVLLTAIVEPFGTVVRTPLAWPITLEFNLSMSF